jgi:hypothetical protein
VGYFQDRVSQTICLGRVFLFYPILLAVIIFKV